MTCINGIRSLQYLLEPIHDLVFKQLPPAVFLQPPTKEITNIFQKVSSILETLPSDIILHVCSADSHKKKRLLIQSTQGSAIIIVNQLYQYEQTILNWQLKQDSKDHYMASYRGIREKLMSIMTVLEQFGQYMNTEQPLPDHVYAEMIVWVKTELQIFSDEWQRRIPKALLDIIQQAIEDIFAVEKGQNPSYSCLQYVEFFFKKTKHLSQSCPPNAEEAMLFTLINLNFNHENLIYYALNQLTPSLTEETNGDELWLYKCLLRKLKHLHPMHGLALYRANADCLQFIIANVQQEICLLELKPTGILEAKASISNKIEHPLTCETSLNIAQLALFLRLLNRSGLFVVKPLDKFFSLVASHVITLRSAKYASRSLEIGFNTPRSNAQQAMKDKLFDLFNELKRC